MKLSENEVEKMFKDCKQLENVFKRPEPLDVLQWVNYGQ